jgi:hypothetical protein
MDSAGSVSSVQTSSAASSSSPPEKTETRAQRVRSAPEHSSQLQSINARSVCCRAGALRVPLVSSRYRSVSRSRI